MKNLITHPMPQIKGQLLFAPMEGITDPLYREFLLKYYNQWAYFSTDFLRLPSSGTYSKKHIIEHYGEHIFHNSEYKRKTIFQVLCSERSLISPTLDKIVDLGFEWIDLNLGCPSKTVCKHFGGSYLLSQPLVLSKILSQMRAIIKGHFSVKMRIGYLDDSNFLQNLSVMKDCGVDSITIHARTRTQLYKGIADWTYLKMAKDHLKEEVPIIGNGDVWSLDDVKKCYHQTGVDAIMIGRGAMKAPWLLESSNDETQASKTQKVHLYLTRLLHFYSLNHPNELEQRELKILKKIKALSRYLFDDFENGDQIKSRLLRSKGMEEFNVFLDDLSSQTHFLQ